MKKHFQLLVRCHQDSMETIIMRRKWGWIGHVLRKDAGNITHSALQWTPQGKWKRGTSKNTWWWTAEEEIKTLNHTWGTIWKLAQNRQELRAFVAALHARGHCVQYVSLHLKLIRSHIPTKRRPVYYSVYCALSNFKHLLAGIFEYFTLCQG